MMKLKYIMDPQCGWCYGNSENISWLNEQLCGSIELELMVGGMWLGNDAPSGGAAFQQFIQSHSPRMEQTTGVEVGKGFYELAGQSGYQFSSLEPSVAITLIKNMEPGKVLQFTKQVQKALFLEGKRLDEIETYLGVLKELEMNEEVFVSNWMKPENIKATQDEFVVAKQLASGYPSLVAELNGEVVSVVSGYCAKNELLNRIEKLLKQ